MCLNAHSFFMLMLKIRKGIYIMNEKFTPEQLEKAYNADIIEFLQMYKGYDFVKKGNYYQCKQHDSLMVYGNRKGFVWNSQKIGGGGAIDFLCRVDGLSFPKAVEAIIGEQAAEYKAAPEYEPMAHIGKLVLPERAEGKYSRVLHIYLKQEV